MWLERRGSAGGAAVCCARSLGAPRNAASAAILEKKLRRVADSIWLSSRGIREQSVGRVSIDRPREAAFHSMKKFQQSRRLHVAAVRQHRFYVHDRRAV